MISPRKFWPRSLTAQIVWAAAIALFVAQAFNFALLIRAREQQAVVQAVSFATARFLFASERAERDMSDEHRRDSDRRRGSRISLSSESVVPDNFKRLEEMEGRAFQELRQQGSEVEDLEIAAGRIGDLPDGVELRGRGRFGGRRGLGGDASDSDRPRPERAILFSARGADGVWRSLAIPIFPGDRMVFAWLVVQTLVLYLAVLIPLALLAHRFARPLRRLTAAVLSRDPVGEGPPVAAEGPQDVRRLIEAFNERQARVANLLSEKDVMLGAIGHDLKTPLAALRIRIENVEDEEDRATMAATVEEMVTILDDILMLARVGRSGEEPVTTDMGALLATVVDEFSDAGRKVALDEVDGGGAGLRLSVRPVLLRRALRNLIGNAVLYGGSASVRVERSGDMVAIHIEDDGPGIDAGEMEQMFEPFVRAERSRNRATGGSGLGLTIARAIARAHGGEIRLVNRQPKGLDAVLELPV